MKIICHLSKLGFELNEIEREILKDCYDEWEKNFGAWFLKSGILRESQDVNETKKALVHLSDLLLIKEDRGVFQINSNGINYFEELNIEKGKIKKQNRINFLKMLKDAYDEDIDKLIQLGTIIHKPENKLEWLNKSELQYLKEENLIYYIPDHHVEGYSVRLTSNGEYFLEQN